MNIRDKDRFLVSFLLAFALHIILFFIAYKADLYLPQTKSVYSGPLLIQVPEFTPRTVSLPEAEEQPEITLPKQAEEPPLSQDTAETSSSPAPPPVPAQRDADTSPPPAPTDLTVTSRAAAAQVLPSLPPPVVTSPPADRAVSRPKVQPAPRVATPPSNPAQRTAPAGAVSNPVPAEPLLRSQDSAAAAVRVPDTPTGTAPITAPDIPKTVSDQPAPQKPSGEQGSYMISDSTPKPGIPSSAGRESVGLVAPPPVKLPEIIPAQQSERPQAQTTVQRPEAPAASSSTQTAATQEQTQPVQTSTMQTEAQKSQSAQPQTTQPQVSQAEASQPAVPVPEQYSATTELDRVLSQIAAKPQESIGTPTQENRSGGLEILTKESLNARRRILRSPEPELPPDVTLEGRPFVEVVAILVITKTGFVSNARVTERSGNVTIDSLIEASLRQWRFEPVANPEEETVLLRVRIEAN